MLIGRKKKKQPKTTCGHHTSLWESEVVEEEAEQEGEAEEGEEEAEQKPLPASLFPELPAFSSRCPRARLLVAALLACRFN